MNRDREVSRLACRNYGVVSRQQLIEMGVPRRTIQGMVKSRKLIPIYRGIYRVPSVPVSWHQKLAAVLPWAGEQSAISHRAAAALFGLDHSEEGIIEVLTTIPRQPPGPGVLVHFTRGLDSKDVVIIDGLRATSVSRTLIDLSAVTSPERLEDALDDALHRRLTDIPRVRRDLERLGQGRRGAAQLRKTLDGRDSALAPTQSWLERRFLRVIRQGRLPAPARQFPVTVDGSDYFIDFAYPEAMLAIEVDSYRFHGKPRKWAKDLERQNRLVGVEWRVLRFTWSDLVDRPGWVVETIAEALRRFRPK